VYADVSISVKYPRAVFTGESAFYYHSLTDVIPDYYNLATVRNDSRIKDARVKQSFLKEEIFDMGKIQIQRNNIMINIYSIERMLIELMRFKGELPFDYYKEIISSYRNKVEKMDIGVHKDLDIEQEEYCFDICFDEDSASVLINSKAQIITEKLKSMLRFGTRSTRYKDVFDICYLSDTVDMEQLRQCLHRYIFGDTTLGVSDIEEIRKRAERIFTSSIYKRQVERSRKNWLDLSVGEVLKKDLEFIRRI